MTNPIITTAELAILIDDPKTKLFDVRGTWATPARDLPEKYAAEHIPGAHYIDWTTDFLQQDIALGLASVADKAAARATFERLGINVGDTVVIYDDNFHMFAGRIWWSMRYWGFENVRVLSGGINHWKRENRPVTADLPAKPDKGTFTPTERPELRLTLDAVIDQKDTSCLVDARGTEGYKGTPDDPRSGHIPGAINLVFKTLLNPETGEFLDPRRIEQVFDKTTPDWRTKPFISSCGAGYTATVVLLALKFLGQDAPLYDGSFGEWKQDPNRPVEQTEQE
jgi:thiosulfate/3-mercaptopyruvate sulfurtransferase